MRVSNLLIHSFVLAAAAAKLEERQFSSSLTAAQAGFPTSTKSASIAANSVDSSGDADDEVWGNSDADDLNWVMTFLRGYPVDHEVDFDTHDLLAEDDTASVNDPNTYSSTNSEDSLSKRKDVVDDNSLIVALIQRRVLWAFARARSHYRQRNSGLLNITQPPALDDWQYAAAFTNGSFVDENLIWNSTDLYAADDDAENDNELLALADLNDASFQEAMRSHSTSNSTSDNRDLAKRKLWNRRHYKHPAKNATQVLRRSLRALRRARKRARERHNQHKHDNHKHGHSKHKHQQHHGSHKHKHKHKQHKHKHPQHAHAHKHHRHASVWGTRGKGHPVKVPPPPGVEPSKHELHKAQRQCSGAHDPSGGPHQSDKAALKAIRHVRRYRRRHNVYGHLLHGIKKCGHHVPWGDKCDGSIDCTWWCNHNVVQEGCDSFESCRRTDNWG